MGFWTVLFKSPVPFGKGQRVDPRATLARTTSVLLEQIGLERLLKKAPAETDVTLV